MEKKKGKRKLLLAIVFLAVLGFGVALFYHAYEYHAWRRDGRVAQETADSIQEIFETYTAAPVAFEQAIDFTGNSDIIAHISIRGTRIANLVVQGEDNAFYLYRDVFGNSNVNGALFLDYRNSPDFSDPNTIIYGHNMNNGTMFHNLRYYVEGDGQAFFEAHPEIQIITQGEALIYEIFSVFITRVDFNYIQTNFAPGEFAGLVEELNRRNTLDTGIYATEEDRLLLLSTCTNISRDTRIVVAGRLRG